MEEILVSISRSGKYKSSHSSWFKDGEQKWTGGELDKWSKHNATAAYSTRGRLGQVSENNQDQTIHYYDQHSSDYSDQKSKFRSNLIFPHYLSPQIMGLLLEAETLLSKHSIYYDNPHSPHNKFLYDMPKQLSKRPLFWL